MPSISTVSVSVSEVLLSFSVDILLLLDPRLPSLVLVDLFPRCKVILFFFYHCSFSNCALCTYLRLFWNLDMIPATPTQTHICTYTLINTYIHTYTYIHAYTYIHTYIHTHIHLYIQTHIHKNTHLHNIHTYIYRVFTHRHGNDKTLYQALHSTCLETCMFTQITQRAPINILSPTIKACTYFFFDSIPVSP